MFILRNSGQILRPFANANRAQARVKTEAHTPYVPQLCSTLALWRRAQPEEGQGRRPSCLGPTALRLEVS